MLVVNKMFQCEPSDLEAVFDWMIHSVTRSAYESKNEGSVLAQFLIAISEIRADTGGVLGSSTPLGSIERTIFWDKLRNTAQAGFLSIRLEPCIAVIQLVLGKTFVANQIVEAIKECDWAHRGKGMFYNASMYPWPIQKQVVDDATMMLTYVPLSEIELNSAQLASYHCIHVKLDAYNKIIDDIAEGSKVDIDYKSIVVCSAFGDVDDYNFYEAVMGAAEYDWFGFRVLNFSTFGKFCGASNLIYCGSPKYGFQAQKEVLILNEKAGFPSIKRLFEPSYLLDVFNYDIPDLTAMPIAFLKNPFASRNRDSDLPLDDPLKYVYWQDLPHGFWEQFGDLPVFSSQGSRIDPEELLKTLGSQESLVDDELAECNKGPPPDGIFPSSSPLKDISNGRKQPPSGPPAIKPKRRKTGLMQFVDSEAGDDCDGGGDEEEVSLSLAQPRP